MLSNNRDILRYFTSIFHSKLKARIYSTTPANNHLNGLSADFKRYNRSYTSHTPVSVAATSGNGLLYSIAPSLTISTDNLKITRGETSTEKL
ncbi:hypothetical protein NF27_CG01170 [Candidatus Jidaibacter acanthamoeba]|uniref:Uncharacterized protein n=1 Tax=Candidatus Jidaibacter acanthamoebae TaxID=86105 RepID=A0A0C1MUZ6_9RICK|nr:hypothetical protein [Candidatus Jidaibacter acanthamoeba]KIE05937.1 hypothetical protein NF27_CG01170 [Candidatus Jidaibacter acanthamoeba]